MSIINASEQHLYEPRDYQGEALDEIERLYAEGVNRQLVFWATGLGKGLLPTEPILTSDGWTLLKNINVGDTLYDQDGSPTKVVGVYPQPELPEWRVTFNDGTEVMTTPQHEWTVRTKSMRHRDMGNWKVRETQELADEPNKWQVPNVDPVEHPERDLPIDPYVYGIILAEGSVTDAVSFKTGDDSIIEEIRKRGVEVSPHSNEWGYGLLGMMPKAREVGVVGKRSWQKSIDPRYLTSSVEQRIDLLRGLMDGDGTVSQEGVGHFSSASKALSEGVCELVRSFGGRTRVRQNKSSLNGEPMRDRFRVRVNLPVNPFNIERKASQYNRNVAQGRSLVIRNAEPTGGTIESICLEVDSPHSNFVMRSHKVTHNSSGCMMHLPQRFPNHVLNHGFLFLAHRRKILLQAYNKFRLAYPDLWVGLEMGEYETVGMEDAVFMSVESVGREYQTRINKYRDRKFGVVVADEGHHVRESSTWDRILNFFGVGSDEMAHYTIPVDGQQVPPLSLFLTATPNRSDEHTLAPFVDAVASEMSILDGIRQGWLTDIKARRVQDVDGVTRTSQGTIDFLLQVYRKFLRPHRTLIFASNVDESQRLADNLNRHGIATAAHIDAETPKEERQEYYEAFEDSSGMITALSNRLVLCLDEETEILTREGWVGIDEMTDEHNVANYWIEDQSVTFEPPEDIVRRDPVENEKMVYVDSPRQNFRVSRWHNMIELDTQEKVWAEDLVGERTQLPMSGYAPPEIMTPKQPNLPNQTKERFISYTSHSYRKRLGMGWKESKRAALKQWEKKQNLKRKNDFTLDELRFCGFWVGDGTRTELQSGGVEYVFSQSKKYEGIIEWFYGLIKSCGFDFVVTDRGDHIRWSFGRGTGGINQNVEGLYEIEHLLDKNGSEFLWSLTRNELEAFIQGLWMADGDHRQVDEPSDDSWIIHNTNEELIDTLQAVASVREFGTRKSKYERDTYKQGYIFHLWIGKRNYWSSGKESIKLGDTPESGERLWCVTTQSGNIITRRRGRVTVMGNTEGYDNPNITALLDNAPTERKHLHIQKLGRGLRPHESAQVDQYDTAQERKEAIRASEKPHLLYVSTFDPTQHSLDVVAAITDEEIDLDAEDDFSLEEVIDRYKELEEEHPELPISDYDSIREIEVMLQSANLYTQTLDNEALKAVTPLNWIVEGDRAALWLPMNPYTRKNMYRDAPTLVEYEREEDGTFTKRIVGGGWNGEFPAPLRTVERNSIQAEDLHECIQKEDQWMRRKGRKAYREVTRRSSDLATEQQKRYLDREGVSYNQNLTAETARLLIDHQRIQQRREKLS